MRLLDRYLLRELSVPLSYCLSAFLAFWVSFDLISNLSDYREAGLGGSELLLYYAYRMPDLLLIIAPVGLLLGMLYTLTNLARHSELVAMRAAGISLMRLSVPYFLVGILFSVGLFALNDLVFSDGNEKAEKMLHDDEDQNNKWLKNYNFRNSRDGRTWNFGLYQLETGEFRNAQVTWDLPDGTRQVIIGQSGAYDDKTWVFTNAAQIVFMTPDTTPEHIPVTNRLEMPLFSETPKSIRNEVKINSLNSITASKRVFLSLGEITGYLQMHNLDISPERRALLLTQYHGRLAAPWTCLVVVLIALPFGAVTGRRNVFVGVASSIVIFFAFYVIQRFGLALGTSGRIPAFIAAWAPNAIFAILGMVLTWRQR